MTRESSNFQKFHFVLFKGLGIDTELGFIVVLWFLSTWSWRTAACDFVMWFVILWFVMWFCDLWGDLCFCDLPTWSWRTAACDFMICDVILWFDLLCDLWCDLWFCDLPNLVVEDCSMLASAGGHFLLLAAKIKDFMRKIVSGYFARKLILRKMNQHCWWERYYFQWPNCAATTLIGDIWSKALPTLDLYFSFPFEKEVWQLSRQFQLHQRLSFHPPTISMPSISSTTISLSYIYSIWDVNYCSYKYIVPKKVVFTLTPV